MRSQILLAVVIVGVLVEAFPVTANGGTISDSYTVPIAPLSWGYVPAVLATLDKFDPALGTLEKVEFELSGDLWGDVYFENMDPLDSHVLSYRLSADIALSLPDTSQFVLPVGGSQVTDVPEGPYDGIYDFGGTSGSTFLDQNRVATGTLNYAGNFGPFIGPGTIDLPMSATGTSDVWGSGTMAEIILSRAGAEVKVTYTYDGNSVPEPSALAISLVISLGMAASGGLAAVRRRRKTARKAAP